MQLVIDCVPYDCVQATPQMIVMQSYFWTQKLIVKSRFTEKYAGFYYDHDGQGNQFIYVDADEENGTITFQSSNEVTLEILEGWFRFNLDGIIEIGYEVLAKAA